ncbi:EpsG family protein [Sphingomonas sp.]|uniref:EpsG family protein n=1 Tax=Sphingomonas sp. TaxID=28214 RepID=UPI00286D8A1A|nr:EpsG family protein [Sphingomonas sp.]
MFILVSYPLFLLYLPDTGYDFQYYEQAFDGVYYDPTADLWFRSTSTLTAEPAWFTYTGLMRYLTDDFRVFLVLNFFLSISLMYVSFKKLDIDPEMRAAMLVMMVPVIFPTVMFWSPRSSISLALVYFGVSLLHNRKTIIGVLVLLLAGSIHSQYLPFVLLVAVFYVGQQVLPFLNRFAITVIGLSILTLTIFASQYILPYLTVLPSSVIITSKLNYLDVQEQGIRFSGFMSLLVYPVLLILFRKKLAERREFPLLVLMVIFSFVINLIFFASPHVAGRISRAADYFLFCYLGAYVVRTYPAAGLVGVALLFAALPLVYTGLYDLNWF